MSELDESDTLPLADCEGGIRGTVADALNFARECSEEWGAPVVVRVDKRRDALPPIVARRADHDGPTWTIRAKGDA